MSEAAIEITAFEMLDGEAGVHALVELFYDLMDLEPQYAELRATHGNTLDDARRKLFWFLCGWLGGPNHYVERFGHPRLHMRHRPFVIGVRERDQWVACMGQAMSELEIEPDLRQFLLDRFFRVADRMRNQVE